MIIIAKHIAVGLVGSALALGCGNVESEAAAASDRAAASMQDLRDHFAACFHPPKEAAGSRVTFYFSLDNHGQVVAKPRTVWLGFKGATDEKSRGLARFEASFRQCLPLRMDTKLSASVPGKVYFLQYVVAAAGDRSDVLLRPFGSHGGGGGLQLPPDTGSSSPGFVDPDLEPVHIPAHPAWMYRPFPAQRPFRQFFFVRPRAAVRVR